MARTEVPRCAVDDVYHLPHALIQFEGVDVDAMVEDLVSSLRQCSFYLVSANNSPEQQKKVQDATTAFGIACEAFGRFTGDQRLRSYVLDHDGYVEHAEQGVEALRDDPRALENVMSLVAAIVLRMTGSPVAAGVIAANGAESFLRAVERGEGLQGGVEFLDGLEHDVCQARDLGAKIIHRQLARKQRGMIVRIFSGLTLKSIAAWLTGGYSLVSDLDAALAKDLEAHVVNRLADASLNEAFHDGLDLKAA